MPNTNANKVEKLHSPTVIASLRDSLDAKRRQMLDLYEHDVQAGQQSTDDNSDDFADRANNSFNRELMFSLSDIERQMLIHIEDAYQRLEEGSYGRCIHCERPIGLPRLKALPWARYCIGCQELEEMGSLDG
ncbi:MAG: TraR/DksA family transcriptional regulator [Acidobacteriota bacterium]